jgi:hypothetical protein
MESKFKKWWDKEQNNFDVSKEMDPKAIYLIILTVAHNAWNESARIEKNKSLIMTDEIITTPSTHALTK